MQIIRVKTDDVLPLRQAVLWPNEPIDFCRVAGDESAWHFAAIEDDGIVSVASVYIDGDSARLRKFATAVEYQGRGIGTKMLRHIISEIKEEGVEIFWCDARESAVNFYTRFGMEIESARFFKSGVAYYKMSVKLMKAENFTNPSC